MKASLEKLLSLGSGPLSSGTAPASSADVAAFGSLGEQLVRLLRERNGFYAFESALHVFPATAGSQDWSLGTWNAPGLWRQEYGELADGMMFFAEDAFGNQFCIHRSEIVLFDAETGSLEEMGGSLEDWAERILGDYPLLTGHPLMNAWQKRHGAILPGKRLMPKTPFVLGGDYVVENLYALGSISAMKTRGNLARQIKDLPDGQSVEFRIVE